MKHFIIGRTRAVHVQFTRYIFVGGSAAVIDVLVFAVLVKYAGMHYAIAAFLAYMLGLLWNYILSLLWIFESKHRRLLEFTMVFLIALGGLLWTEFFLWIFVGLIGFEPVISKLIVLWIVLLWNFGMRKVYVFH